MAVTGEVYEWRIENLSHWCAEVHGHCIRSPNLSYFGSFYMELYPKGIGGQGEHLVVRLGDVATHSGELSIHTSDGFLLYSEQPVNVNSNRRGQELPPGPKFKYVLSRIGEDSITVSLRIDSEYNIVRRKCTTINVTKISFKMNPGWFEEMETKDFFYIQLPPNDILHIMWLKVCSENDTVHFRIQPPTNIEIPFAVEMRFTASDGTVDRCAKKEHVFRDNNPWTFPESLQKKELVGNGISLLLCLKTRDLFHGSFHMNCAYSCVRIAPNNTLCFSEIEPPTDPGTSIKDSVEVLTKDSASQTSLTSNMPDDSVLVLSKELMCLYQDQDFSDITLKCDHVSFPVHKNVLSARSPVFKTMLSTDMAEAASGEVDIGDLDPSTLGLFLTHLYTGAVEEELQCDRALKLYYAADKYQVPSLKRDCSKFLCGNVSVSNVCDILSLADKHRDDRLLSVAQEFILDHFNEVLKSNEWETFMCRESLLAVKTLTHFGAKDSVKKYDSK